MNVCINATELRKALADIEKAEANGFDHCLAVLQMVSAGPMIDDNMVEYSDMIEKAHPTDGSKDWGRFQGVSRRNRYDKETGELIPL